jgi:hypothetical protein
MEEALIELRTNLREAEKEYGKKSVEVARSKAGLGKGELLMGNVEEGESLLQEAMHNLHASLGHAHPVAHSVQKLWVSSGLTDWSQPENKSRLIKQMLD